MKKSKKMLQSKIVKNLLKIFVSLFFLWWTIFKVNWIEVLMHLRKLSLLEILLYMSVYIIGILISSYKWQFLASHKGIKLPLGKFFKFYFTATFVNNFMPSFIGGDSYKVYRVGKLSGKFKASTSSVIMDRLTGLWGGMVLAILFSLFNLNLVLQNNILLVLNIGVIGLLFFGFIFFQIFKERRLKTPFEKLTTLLNKIIAEINSYNDKNKVIWKAIGLSFLFNLVGLAGANYILFQALGVDIRLIDYLSVIFLVSVVSSLPISINNIGVKEWAYITFFGFFGLSAGAVVSVAILGRIVQMLLSFLAFPIYLSERNKQKKLSITK